MSCFVGIIASSPAAQSALLLETAQAVTSLHSTALSCSHACKDMETQHVKYLLVSIYMLAAYNSVQGVHAAMQTLMERCMALTEVDISMLAQVPCWQQSMAVGKIKRLDHSIITCDPGTEAAFQAMCQALLCALNTLVCCYTLVSCFVTQWLVLCCAVLCRAVLCRAVPCRAVPCRAVLCRAVLCRAVPCCAVLCRAVPCCAVLSRAVACHVAPAFHQACKQAVSKCVDYLSLKSSWTNSVLIYPLLANKKNRLCWRIVFISVHQS